MLKGCSPYWHGTARLRHILFPDTGKIGGENISREWNSNPVRQCVGRISDVHVCWPSGVASYIGLFSPVHSWATPLQGSSSWASATVRVQPRQPVRKVAFQHGFLLPDSRCPVCIFCQIPYVANNWWYLALRFLGCSPLPDLSLLESQFLLKKNKMGKRRVYNLRTSIFGYRLYRDWGVSGTSVTTERKCHSVRSWFEWLEPSTFGG